MDWKLPAGVELRDIMGNRVKNPLVSSSFVYICGPKTALDAVTAMLKSPSLRPLGKLQVKTMLDPATKQYVLDVTLANSGHTALSGQLQLVPPTLMRAFWADPKPVKELKPGQSVSFRIPLNLYKGPAYKPKSAHLVLQMGSLTMRHPIANVLDAQAADNVQTMRKTQDKKIEAIAPQQDVDE